MNELTALTKELLLEGMTLHFLPMTGNHKSRSRSLSSLTSFVRRSGMDFDTEKIIHRVEMTGKIYGDLQDFLALFPEKPSEENAKRIQFWKIDGSESKGTIPVWELLYSSKNGFYINNKSLGRKR